ncbi:MAG: hypothetical protein ABMA14_09635 [Hyphomonadaceae bacterium]
MTTRVTTRVVTFEKAFRLDEVDGLLPAGSYRVETEDETLDSVSFVAHRRIATHTFAPSRAGAAGGTQMWKIHPNGVSEALSQDLHDRDWANAN